MAATPLNVTVGDPNMNAYCTVAVADQYNADRPNPAEAAPGTWGQAGPDAKVQAILWATKLLDAIYVWTGMVSDINQPLLWPRWGMFRRNDWQLVPVNAIPIELQYATAEYARQLLVTDRAGDSDLETQRISSVRAGSVAVTFSGGVVAKPLPDTVYYLIPQSWGYPRSRSTGVREVQRA